MIDGVNFKPLKKIPDERGTILHMLRNDDPKFTKFGEIYFSKIYPGVVKGWHLHTQMTLNYAVISGMVKIVLFDDREKSKTRGKLMEIFTGDENYGLITIPPMVWNGFKGVGNAVAIVANLTDIPHHKDEIKRMDPLKNNLIQYNWEVEFK